MTMTWNSVMGIALLLMGAAAAEAKTNLWLHIKVHDGHDDSRVSINLPLSVVEAATPLIPEEVRTASQLRVDGHDLSVPDLRRIWREVQRQPDAAYVTIDEGHARVRVARSGGYLLIRAADRDASAPAPESGGGGGGSDRRSAGQDRRGRADDRQRRPRDGPHVGGRRRRGTLRPIEDLVGLLRAVDHTGGRPRKTN